MDDVLTMVRHSARNPLAQLMLCAAVVLALAAPAQADAAGTGPQKIINPGDPGSSQYQEDVPSAFGNVPASHPSTGRGRSAGTTTSLPPAVAAKLAHAGAAGQAAAALALAGTPQGGGSGTSRSRRGPQESHGHSGSGGGSGSSGGGIGGSGPGSGSSDSGAPSIAQAGSGKSVVAALASSVVGSDGGAGALLPILLVASALLAVGLLARRRHRGS